MIDFVPTTDSQHAEYIEKVHETMRNSDRILFYIDIWTPYVFCVWMPFLALVCIKCVIFDSNDKIREERREREKYEDENFLKPLDEWRRMRAEKKKKQAEQAGETGEGVKEKFSKSQYAQKLAEKKATDNRRHPSKKSTLVELGDLLDLRKELDNFLHENLSGSSSSTSKEVLDNVTDDCVTQFTEDCRRVLTPEEEAGRGDKIESSDDDDDDDSELDGSALAESEELDYDVDGDDIPPREPSSLPAPTSLVPGRKSRDSAPRPRKMGGIPTIPEEDPEIGGTIEMAEMGGETAYGGGGSGSTSSRRVRKTD